MACHAATAAARTAVGSPRTTRTNSSPDSRAATTTGGGWAARRRPTSVSRSLPASCPYLSLIVLNLSRSSRTRPWGQPRRAARCSRARTARRLGQAGDVVVGGPEPGGGGGAVQVPQRSRGDGEPGEHAGGGDRAVQEGGQLVAP